MNKDPHYLRLAPSQELMKELLKYDVSDIWMWLVVTKRKTDKEIKYVQWATKKEAEENLAHIIDIVGEDNMEICYIAKTEINIKADKSAEYAAKRKAKKITSE